MLQVIGLGLILGSFIQETSITQKEWIAKLRQSLKQLYDIEYDKVVCHSLWGMRCLILAKPEHSNKIAHVQTSSVKTGIGNKLGKGRRVMRGG